MSPLFEYGQWEKANDKEELKRFLRGIWQQRLFAAPAEEVNEAEDSRYQPFLQFEDDRIRACNYVGFIQTESDLLEIYPKVFVGTPKPDRQLMLRHIFYWFGYCRKWRFPFSQASLDIREIDTLPELIIHLMARQFLQTISEQPLMQYQEVGEPMQTPRGSINFSRYASASMSRGNFHQIECDHEPFLFDNKVNRIIKYCARVLSQQARFSENQRALQEVLFVLDEVEDVNISIQDLNTVKLNAFFADYELLMDMCGMILRQQIYSNRDYDMSQWCLLFPMEYVFEDFIAGFLEQHFSDRWKVEYQKSDAYLSTNPKAFNLQHDIFLTSRDGGERKIIVDTKYKLRQFEEGDPKKGIAQSDLYQVVSYAYRRGCDEVMIIYPNAGERLRAPDHFEIPSGFPGGDVVRVTAVEVPFWSIDCFLALDLQMQSCLSELLRRHW